MRVYKRMQSRGRRAEVRGILFQCKSMHVAAYAAGVGMHALKFCTERTISLEAIKRHHVEILVMGMLRMSQGFQVGIDCQCVLTHVQTQVRK